MCRPWYIKHGEGDFPGGPVVKTLSLTMDSILGRGTTTKILHASMRGQKKKNHGKEERDRADGNNHYYI